MDANNLGNNDPRLCFDNRNNLLFKYIMNTFTTMNNIYKVYDMIPQKDNSKQLILEPLSCVLKLGLLQHKPLGTKISVSHNSLHFHEPSFLQGITRSLGGDSRQDLHNICHPIMKCLEWFPLTKYAFFYDECLKGLQQFKSSYEEQSLINHTIEHYIGLVTGKEYEPMEGTAVVSGLKDTWSPKELLIVKTILEHINEHEDPKDKQDSITILEQMLVIKEQKVNTYIQSISTSY
jgi:hypothetical protein